jgi:hypothetical protein
MQRIRHPGKAKPGRAAQRAPVFIFSPWLLSSLIGCLCIFGDVGQLNLATCQYFHVSMGSRYFAHSPSVRMQGDVDISSKDDPLQSNVCPSARTYFDRMLARVWQLPAAQDGKKFHGSINFRPFRIFRPRLACRARSTPVPKSIQP